MRWQLASTFAVTAMSAGCYGPNTVVCENGVLCPEGQVCTDNATQPYCAFDVDVTACAGSPEGHHCASERVPSGYCASTVCVTCEPTPEIAGCRYDTWTKVPSSAQNLQGVAVTGMVEAYAAGGNGVVLAYNGLTWTQMPPLVSGTQPALVDVWGIGGDVFAIDNSRNIYRPGFAVVQAPEVLYRIVGTSPSDVVVVGDAGLYGVFDGSGWTWSYGAALTYYAASITEDLGVLVAGIGEIRFRPPSSSSWQVIAPPNNDPVLGVWGITGSDFYVVGYSELNPQQGVVHHYANGVWDTPSVPLGLKQLSSIWGSGASEIHAVGADGTFLDYDGSGWRLSRPVGPSEPQLTDIDGYGRDAVAIAGDGSIWRISPKP